MTYCLSNAPVGTLHTFDSEVRSMRWEPHVFAGLTRSIQGQVILPPYTLTTEYATVKFSQTEFTVDPGQSETIVAEFTAPTIEGTGGYPAYSGHIVITSPSETLTVSYLGVVGSVKDIQLLADSDPAVNFSLPALQSSDGTGQNGTVKYTFVGLDIPTLVLG